MDMLLATANVLARRSSVAEHPVRTAADEDAYYARHTLNIIVPAWVPAVSALLRNFRAAPERIRAARHA